MRFLLYSHDGAGLGHTRRHIAIASAIIGKIPDAAVLMVTGTDDVHALGLPPKVEVLKVPGLRKIANGHYGARRIELDGAEILALRSAVITAAVKSFQPDVMLVDKHPFGAGGELKSALSRLRSQGGRAVLGLRDILDDRETVLKEWEGKGLQRAVAATYDQVFVYGNRDVFDPMVEYDFPAAVATRTRFCGFVVNETETATSGALLRAPGDQRPVVLATAGGGEDGLALLECFIESAHGAPWRGIAVAGPMAGQDLRESLQRQAAAAGVEFHTFLPDMPAVLRSIDALVCMGGYNTLAEAVSSGVPTVCMPRTTPRLEQKIRALAFERLDLLRVVLPGEAHTPTMRRAITEALRLDRTARRERASRLLGFQGANEAARHLIDLATPRFFRRVEAKAA